MAKIATVLPIAIVLALGACASGDGPDESGLTPPEKAELVERYYACARERDAGCVRAALHPDFTATDHPAGAMAAPAHADTVIALLRQLRVEARILPHEGAELWVVEMWIDQHGASGSRLRSFRFEDRLIREKTTLAG